MALELKIWAEQIKKDPHFFDENGNLKYGEISQYYFHRDPVRPVFKQDDVFLAPADGVVVSNGIYSIEDDTYFLKGAEFDIDTIIGNDETFWKYLVSNKVKYVQIISIFMMFYSVHINRCPIDSKLLKRKYQMPVLTKNQPMVSVEDKLLLGNIGAISYSDIENYYSVNERVISHYKTMKHGYHYELVQIADQEVDAIWNINDSGSNFTKAGKRIGGIRKGSTCDIILPLVNGVHTEILPAGQVGMVVEGGTDSLVKIYM